MNIDEILTDVANRTGVDEAELRAEVAAIATELSGFEEDELRNFDVQVLGAGHHLVQGDYRVAGVTSNAEVVLVRAGRTATEIELEALQRATNNIQARMFEAKMGPSTFDLEAALAELGAEVPDDDAE